MIHVISPGLLSSFQDTGRFGYRKFGVPLSGAMDAYSAGLANMFLNNPEDVAVLEITLHGPVLNFECPAEIVITGADLSPKINGRSFLRNSIVSLTPGDQLTFGKVITGCRSYLAVRGGFTVKKILGSSSYYPGLSDDAVLKTGMTLSINSFEKPNKSNASVRIFDHFSDAEIIVDKGPEFECLNAHQQSLLLGAEFLVTPQNNRMGYQLSGPKLECDFQMVTDITIPGTVQLTPAGNPIVLMRDCQTTGGYPRILQLTSQSINRLAQKKTNDIIRFRLQEIAE